MKKSANHLTKQLRSLGWADMLRPLRGKSERGNVLRQTPLQSRAHVFSAPLQVALVGTEGFETFLG